jgi:hypothetical protein
VKRGLIAVVATICVFVCSCQSSGPALAPHNEGSYSFFVAGHTYGVNGVNNAGVHPPFKEFFAQLNSLDLDFGVFTGDTVYASTPTDWDEIDEDLEDLNVPVRFAVGNHDMQNRELFVSRYGSTYYSFENSGDLFIVLDSELDRCNITGDQLRFLREALDTTRGRNNFIFVHKVLWVAEGTPYYDALRHEINAGPGIAAGCDSEFNFWTEIVPMLQGLDAPVYIVAGDVGCDWAMSLFYDEFENLHFIASGMGGAEEENFLVFDVQDGNVQITAYRLDGQPLKLGAVEAYNLEYYTQP